MTRKLSSSFSNPLSDGLISRPRLLALLQSISDNYAAAWISSPAGAGKTSLLASYMDRRGRDAIWIRFQENDGDPGVFLHTLQSVISELSEHSVNLSPPDPLTQPTDYFEHTLAVLMESIHEQSPLVWDNCEYLAGQPAQLKALAGLVEATSQHGCRHFFLSRSEPPAEFGRLLVRRQMATLDWPMIKLDREEFGGACELLCETPPPKAQIEEWYTLSDGWFAALILLVANSAVSIEGQAANSSSIFEYLASEVLSELSHQHQELLTSLSLLPYINRSLAGELGGGQAAYTQLQQLSRRLRLIEASAGPDAVYRLHPLLREFLQQRMQRELNGDARRQLQQRSAAALLAEGDIEAAGTLLCDSCAWAALGQLIKTEAGELINSGRAGLLLQWLAELPIEQLNDDLWLRYWQAMCQRFEQPEVAWPALAGLFEAFKQSGDVVGQYTVWVSLVEAILIVFEDLKPLKRWLEEYHALRQRHPRCPDLVLRVKTLTLAGSVMSVVAPRHPKLQRLIRFSEIAVRMIPFKTPRQALFMYLILHYANTGQVASMHAMARHLLPALDENNLPAPLRVFGYAMIGLHEIVTGESQVGQTLDNALELAGQVSGGIYYCMPQCYRTYLSLVEGRIGEARERYSDYQQHLPPNQRMHQAAHDFLLAWMLAVEADTGGAMELSRQSKDMCIELQFDFGLALNTNLRAQLFSQQREFTAAAEELAVLQRLAEESDSRLLRAMHGFSTAWLALKQSGEPSCVEVLQTVIGAVEQEGILAFPGFLRPVMAELAQIALQHQLWPSYFERLVLRWQLVPQQLIQKDNAWPWMVRVYTLGRFEVLIRGIAVDFSASQRRPLELLAVLIAQGGRDVPKTALCDTLWNDSEADKAAHALDNLLHRLRKLLGRDVVLVNSGYVSINPQLCWVDTWALQTMAEETDDHMAGELLAVYAGSFLPAEDSAWVILARDRLRWLFLRGVRQCLDRLMVNNLLDAATDLLEHASHVEPTVEDLYLWLMQVYAQREQSAEAVRAYQRCARVLHSELGVQPRAELTDYYHGLTA